MRVIDGEIAAKVYVYAFTYNGSRLLLVVRLCNGFEYLLFSYF